MEKRDEMITQMYLITQEFVEHFAEAAYSGVLPDPFYKRIGFFSLWTYYDVFAFSSYLMVEGRKFDVFFLPSWQEEIPPVEAPGVLARMEDTTTEAHQAMVEERIELRELVTILFENVLHTFRLDKPNNLGEITKIERDNNYCVTFAYEANNVIYEFVIFIR